MLSRRREFAARGPVPPWWRRPAVLVVVGLLVVGGGLAASEGVNVLLASQQVRETSAAVERIELPDGFEEWPAACGDFGLRCAATDQPPQVAVDAMATRLAELGHDVEAARCGEQAQIEQGTRLATLPRHDTQCATTTQVRGGVLTVAAWDYLPPFGSGAGDGLELGRTAVVVEWDATGTDLLTSAEPQRVEARFADVPVTPAEIEELPGALSRSECVSENEEGCQLYEVTLEGPDSGRMLLEAWAGELLDAHFLVTSFSCDEDGPAICSLVAETGRSGGERSSITVSIDVDAEERNRATARVFTF